MSVSSASSFMPESPRWPQRLLGKLGGAFAPPARVTGTESLFMRLLFALVIPQFMPANLQRSTMPKPNGLGQWIDFTWMAAPGMEGLIYSALIALLILYVLGAGLAVVTPLILAISVAVRTLENSAGSIHHGYQVLSMVLLLQSAVYIWQSSLGKSLLGQQKQSLLPASLRDHSQEAWVLWASQLAIISLYAVSVWSKWTASDGRWLLDSHGFATEVVKSHRQSYFNRLDGQFGVPGVDAYPAWAAWIAAHPNLARLMFGSGFFLELVSFLALLRWRWVACVVGLGLIGMHSFIDVVMNLEFPENVDCLWIFFVGVPWLLAWPVDKFVRLFGKWTRPTEE